MSKKLPLHDIHEAAGARFMDLFGWQIVQKFSIVQTPNTGRSKNPQGWLIFPVPGFSS